MLPSGRANVLSGCAKQRKAQGVCTKQHFAPAEQKSQCGIHQLRDGTFDASPPLIRRFHCFGIVLFRAVGFCSAVLSRTARSLVFFCFFHHFHLPFRDADFSVLYYFTTFPERNRSKERWIFLYDFRMKARDVSVFHAILKKH